MECARVSYYYYDPELDKVHAFFQKFVHVDNEIYSAILNRVGEGLGYGTCRSHKEGEA